jgi:His-Xaa-Ser system protein HxsD
MRFEFAKAAYSATALQKAAYEVAADLTIIITEEGPHYVVNAVSTSKGKPDVDLSAFVRNANDYALREKLAAETAPLRNLVLAHAYSKTQFIRK